jgi:hypothetical protein
MHRLLLTALAAAALTAAEPTAAQAPAPAPAGLADAAVLVARSATATTQAQRFAVQNLAKQRLAGASFSADLVVEDVVAVQWKGQAAWSIECRNPEPAFRISAYTGDEATALTLNRGDRVRITGTAVGLNLGKEAVLIVEQVAATRLP